MKHKKFSFAYKEFSSENELSDSEKKMVAEARKASRNAYAPYSGFCVGASVLLVDGTIITGNNQENAAYRSGLCAERVALFFAQANHPGVAVKAIAVTARKKNHETDFPVYPCGACRQVIAEARQRSGAPIAMLFAGKKIIQSIEDTKFLLPLEFDKSVLSNQ